MSIDYNSLNNIIKTARRIYETDLLDISRRNFPTIFSTVKDIYDNYIKFEEMYFNKLDRNLFYYYDSIFQIALLKLSIVLSEKTPPEYAKDELIRSVISMYTNDEKKAIKELEKFSKLDPKVTPPEVLANIIISESSEIYYLIKEAIKKQYIDFSNLIKTWSKELKIGDAVTRGLSHRYNSIFRNIIDAIKMLLDQHPLWIMRLFKDYEDALLKSSEIRTMFEDQFRKIFEPEMKNLEIKLKCLEEERSKLLSTIDSLSTRLVESDRSRENIENELFNVKESYYKLKREYDDLLEKWNNNIGEFNKLREQLDMKEKELKELAEKEKENSAARVALEAEIHRLKSLINEYESKVNEYEDLKESLSNQLKALEDKASNLEKALKGEVTGTLVYPDEAALLELIFINKLSNKLNNNLPLKIVTPWGDEKIDEWEEVNVMSEGTNLISKESSIIPGNRSITFIYTKKKFLGLGEEKHIEIRGIFFSHINKLRTYNFDNEPATLEDLLKIMGNLIKPETEKTKKLIVLGISSPTGWSERVIQHIRGQETYKSLVFKNLAVILIDQLRGEIHYPKVDWVEFCANLFKPEINEEEERKIEEKLRELIVETYKKQKDPHGAIQLSLEDLERGFDPKPMEISILRVINRYENKGLIKRKNVNGKIFLICEKISDFYKS